MNAYELSVSRSTPIQLRQSYFFKALFMNMRTEKGLMFNIGVSDIRDVVVGCKFHT